jgi:hypothetical protein
MSGHTRDSYFLRKARETQAPSQVFGDEWAEESQLRRVLASIDVPSGASTSIRHINTNELDATPVVS